jgi:FkbM family methyltransferase
MLAGLKRIIRTVTYSIIPPPFVPDVPASYSQAGEDAILRFLLADKKMSRVSYLDVGTNVPDFGNNTYLFYRSGSSGVCVEADRTLIPEIARVRPRDKVLNVGVSTGGAAEADFYIFDAKGISTFNKAEADQRAASGHFKLTEVVKVKLADINSILRENFARCPDLLSIDIEGLDLAVLKTLDFERYPIPVICVETCRYSENHVRPKDHAIVDFMSTKDYEVYADTYINTIFVSRAWFYQSSAVSKRATESG